VTPEERRAHRARITIDTRRHVRDLAEAADAAGDPVGWFETLYAEAGFDDRAIPWADGEPNVNLLAWLDRERVEGGGRPALVVGCGLGDDAEHLVERGFAVTAFDVSPTAIEWARRLHAGSRVSYEVADLLQPPAAWLGAYALVVESYTLQALPIATRGAALRRLAALVAPGGTLLVICRGRDDDADVGGIPWPVSRAELRVLETDGLVLERAEDYPDVSEEPPERRFRLTYRAPDPS